MNPYNCTKPGMAFVGYEDVIEEMMNGFINGNSYAVLGGRRCGKTSFLIQMEKMICDKGLAPFHALAGRFSVQELGKPTPNILFEKIYDMTTQGIGADVWKDGQADREYQHFLKMMDNAAPNMTQKYGTDWLVIMMIDELDAPLTELADELFFQNLIRNLRNLLMESRYNRHFRLIATGVKEVEKMSDSGSSPMNNLRNLHLGILTESSAKTLVDKGFSPYSYQPVMLKFVFDLSGRHPFILQGILENLWTSKASEWNKQKIGNATRKFLKERGGDFQHWVDGFSIAEKTIYRVFAESSKSQLHISEIRNAISKELRPESDDALNILSYHGIIDTNDQSNPKIAGTLFRTWFIEHTLDYKPPEKLLKAQAILKELSADLSKLPIDDAIKKEISKLLIESAATSDKDKIGSSLEKITEKFKQAKDAGDAIAGFIEKAEKLGPYIGMAAGWLAMKLF